MQTMRTTNHAMSYRSILTLLLAIYTSVCFAQQSKERVERFTLGSRALKTGMTGPDVMQLNELLLTKKLFEAHAKWPRNPKRYGRPTRLAVKAYQLSKQLVVTGKVDQRTLYHLKYD